MIGKQIKGSNFTRLLSYLFSKPGAKLIGGNMIGETPEELAAEFRFSVLANSRVKKPVFHAILSISPDENLNDLTWNKIADEYMEGMQFTANSYAVIRHTDREHDHVHIASSRIRLDDRGTCVTDSWDYPRSEKLIRELEKKYNLGITESSSEKDRQPPTIAEYKRLEKTSIPSIKMQLQNTLDTISNQQPTMPELIEILKDRGIDVRVKPTDAGKPGISYSYQGVALSGSQLGKAYTFQGLQKHRSISYEPSRDDEAILKACERPPADFSINSDNYPEETTAVPITKPNDSDADDTTNPPATNYTAREHPEIQQYQPLAQNPEPLELLPETQAEGLFVSPKPNNSEPETPTDKNNQALELAQQLLRLQQIHENALAKKHSTEPDHLAQWIAKHQNPIQSDSKEQPSTEIPDNDAPTPARKQRHRPPEVTAEIPDESQPSDRAISPSVEDNWETVRQNLEQLQGLPHQLLEQLHDRGWLNANASSQAVFSLRTLGGEQTGAYILNPQSRSSSIVQESDRSGCFWIATTNNIEKAIITSNPIETLSAIAADPTFNQNKTLYLSLDKLDTVTQKFLSTVKEIFIGLTENKDNKN